MTPPERARLIVQLWLAPHHQGYPPHADELIAKIAAALDAAEAEVRVLDEAFPYSAYLSCCQSVERHRRHAPRDLKAVAEENWAERQRLEAEVARLRAAAGGL